MPPGAVCWCVFVKRQSVESVGESRAGLALASRQWLSDLFCTGPQLSQHGPEQCGGQYRGKVAKSDEPLGWLELWYDFA